MRIIALIIPALIVSFSLIAASTADAKKRKYTRKGTVFCQGDHLHYGSSDSFKTKRLAMRDAIASWRGFTVFEYGEEWGNWRISRNKAVKCGRKDRLWSCSIQSTPCRRARRGE